MSGYKPLPSTAPDFRGKENVRMFDRISPVYDVMNRLMSLGMDLRWRRKTIEFLDIPPHATILDLACGTGDMMLLASRVSNDIKIVGADPSLAMIRTGRKRYVDQNFALVNGWGESLPFADNCFDRAMMAFGIRNFSDRKYALSELHRVTKTGGRLAILEMTTRKRTFFETLFGWYFRGLVPLIGRLISRDKTAYRFLPASVDIFPEPADFAAEIISNGWQHVSWRSFSGGVVTLFHAMK